MSDIEYGGKVLNEICKEVRETILNKEILKKEAEARGCVCA